MGMATATVLEHCRVSPPPGAVDQKSLPLTFFELLWLNFHPISYLIFYDFPCSKSHFTQTVIPKLKNSLSLVLKHFFPLASNLIVPSGSSSTNKLPEILYSDGDSVSLTFAECSSDFSHLAGNHPRKVDELLSLVPQLLAPVTSGDYKIAPLLALQVTFFPNQGITVGFTIDHVLGDGSAMFSFRSTWAKITKLGRDVDAPLLSEFQLPFYDRSLIKDPKGLATIFWSQTGNKEVETSTSQPAMGDKVLATFVMSRANIQELKNLLAKKRPTLAHVSSFTVVCAYAWTCMTKARAMVNNGEKVQEEDEVEHFVYSINCRGRLDVHIPENYFGNCVASSWASAKTTQLMEDEGGFLTAAEAIGEAIRAKFQNAEGGVLKGAETWIEEIEANTRQRYFGVAGSPNFDVYSIDFGWGKPKKVEVVSERFSLSRCKDSQGNLEIGVRLPKSEMDAFSTIFNKGLIN